MTLRQILEELCLQDGDILDINKALSQIVELLESEKKDFKHQSVEFQNGYITAIDHLIKKVKE